MINLHVLNIQSSTSHEDCDECLCSCSKLFSNVNDDSNLHGQKLNKRNDVKYNHTSCGLHAYKKGSGQKVRKAYEILVFHDTNYKKVILS